LACIINAYAMSASGFALGFYRGWSLTLAFLGIVPILGLGMIGFSYMLTSKNAEVMKAYS
jgi:predicted lysophospholipase L1 biosynthesis ABC-type transport system permease subunit